MKKAAKYSPRAREQALPKELRLTVRSKGRRAVRRAFGIRST